MDTEHLCLCCHAPMDVQEQTTFRGTPILLVTCWNKSCPMYRYTLAAEDYTEELVKQYCGNPADDIEQGN